MVFEFGRNVQAYPSKNALFVEGRYYSYRELWQIVLEIYSQIPSSKSFQCIGVFCSDDVISYASILAINLYGAAYVPLNKNFPLSKNKKIVEQCKLELIITSLKKEKMSPLAVGVEMLQVDSSKFSAPDWKPEFIPEAILSETYTRVNQPISYILFTSGSTGEPKGVPVSHANVSHFFNYFLKHYPFNEKDRFLQVYELTFDVSVFSFFMPLMVGACCYVLPSNGIKYLKIVEALKDFEITVVSMVPTVLGYLEKYLKEISLPELRFSFFSGDALYHHLAVSWKKSIPNAEIHNFYGPTETTIVCTRYPFDEQKSKAESEHGIVPLGKAFEGMETLLVDEDNMPCDKGELCFSGTQVIAQYLNGSNEKQFFNYQNKRFYKTGDLAAFNEQGNLVFYGRSDSQVKINGFRIELAEIENALASFLKEKAIVMSKKNKQGINELVLFVENGIIDKEQIIEKLSLILPDYMLPHHFVSVENFKMNENGKIDKQSLLDFM